MLVLCLLTYKNILQRLSEHLHEQQPHITTIVLSSGLNHWQVMLQDQNPSPNAPHRFSRSFAKVRTSWPLMAPLRCKLLQMLRMFQVWKEWVIYVTCFHLWAPFPKRVWCKMSWSCLDICLSKAVARRHAVASLWSEVIMWQNRSHQSPNHNWDALVFLKWVVMV